MASFRNSTNAFKLNNEKSMHTSFIRFSAQFSYLQLDIWRQLWFWSSMILGLINIWCSYKLECTSHLDLCLNVCRLKTKEKVLFSNWFRAFHALVKLVSFLWNKIQRGLDVKIAFIVEVHQAKGEDSLTMHYYQHIKIFLK